MCSVVSLSLFDRIPVCARFCCASKGAPKVSQSPPHSPPWQNSFHTWSYGLSPSPHPPLLNGFCGRSPKRAPTRDDGDEAGVVGRGEHAHKKNKKIFWVHVPMYPHWVHALSWHCGFGFSPPLAFNSLFLDIPFRSSKLSAGHGAKKLLMLLVPHSPFRYYW